MTDKAFQGNAFQQDAFQAFDTRALSRAGAMSAGFSRAGTRVRTESRAGSGVTVEILGSPTKGRFVDRAGTLDDTILRTGVIRTGLAARIGTFSAAVARLYGQAVRNFGRVGAPADASSSTHIARRTTPRSGTTTASSVTRFLPRMLFSRVGSFASVVEGHRIDTYPRRFTAGRRVGFQYDAFQADAFQAETPGRGAAMSRAIILRRNYSRAGSLVAAISRRGAVSRTLSRVGSISTAVSRRTTSRRALTRIGSIVTSASRLLVLGRLAPRSGALTAIPSRVVVYGRTLARVASPASTVSRRVANYRRVIGRVGAMIAAFVLRRPRSLTPISFAATYTPAIEGNASYTPAYRPRGAARRSLRNEHDPMSRNAPITPDNRWYRHELKLLEFTTIDADDLPYDLSAKDLTWKLLDRPGGTALLTKTTGGGGIVIAGNDANIARVTVAAGDYGSIPGGAYHHELWDTTDGALLASGLATIREATG